MVTASESSPHSRSFVLHQALSSLCAPPVRAILRKCGARGAIQQAPPLMSAFTLGICTGRFQLRLEVDQLRICSLVSVCQCAPLRSQVCCSRLSQAAAASRPSPAPAAQCAFRVALSSVQTQPATANGGSRVHRRTLLLQTLLMALSSTSFRNPATFLSASALALYLAIVCMVFANFVKY